MAKKEKVESIEIIESPEALQQEVSKVTELVDKNKSSVATILGVVVVLVAAYFGYQWYSTTQDAEGEKKLFKAVYAFESDSLAAASKDLAKVSDEFGGNTQNLADLYLGITLLKQGKFDQSIEKLKNFSSSDGSEPTNSKPPSTFLIKPSAIESALTAFEISRGAYCGRADMIGKASAFKTKLLLNESYSCV